MYTNPHISAPTDGLPMPRRLGAILAVSFGVSLSVIDGSIANVALPTISAQLGISAADSIWIVNAYQLAIMVSLLSFSALGDVLGYRKIYIGGLALFTVASVGCALSGSFQTLVLARVMQGFGAAAVTSVNTTLVRFIYPRARLGRGLGINATVVAVSSVAGPTIAAGILSVADWPWLFAVNIPVGVAALTLSHRFLPSNPVKDAAHHFSWRDALMNALTFGLMMSSIEGFSHGLDPRILSLGIAAMLIIGFFFIRSQLRETYPILPFDLLRIPIFSVSVLTSICSFLGQMLAMVALPFYLQHTCGYSDVETGLLLTAWPAIIMIVAPVAGLLVERVHAGLLGGVGLTAMAAGLFLLAWLPENPSHGDIIWRLMLCGAGFGFFQSPNNSILIASAPPTRSGSASGMLATARLVGQTTGAALMALLFHLVPQNSTHAALMLAGCFAIAAANGTPEALRCDGPTVLFIEEIGEFAYRIDRMMQSLERCGVLRQLRAVVVGHFTKTIGCEKFGVESAESILDAYLRPLGIPVVYGFPAGHDEPNRALYLGREVTVRVDEAGASLDFSPAN